jgi:hypothetical protein
MGEILNIRESQKFRFLNKVQESSQFQTEGSFWSLSKVHHPQ